MARPLCLATSRSYMHKISGSQPGVFDRTQPSRLLRLHGAKLSFAAFDPLTAYAQDGLDLTKLDLNTELYRPKRVVIETAPSGECTWRFVPSAKREEGVIDEGTWPRIVDLCGEFIKMTQDQWDIYKLDPLYECLVRGHSQVTTIRNVSGPRVPSPKLAGKRRMTSRSPTPSRAMPPPRTLNGKGTFVESESEDEDEDEDEDEVEFMIISDEQPSRPRHRSATRETRERIQKDRQERREKLSRKMGHFFQGGEVYNNVYPNGGTFDRPRTPERGSATPEASKRKVQRKLKQLERKRMKHAQRKQQERAVENETRRRERERRWLNEIMEEMQEDDDEATHRAAIEESRRKLAELERDRPLWEEEARQRRIREEAKQQALKMKAEMHQREEDRKKAEAEAQARKEREQDEMQKREQEKSLKRERELREQEKRQRQQRWAYGPWTTQRALERYRVLSEAFDNTKFTPDCPLTVEDVPWPSLQSPVNFAVEDVNWDSVERFFEAVRTHLRLQDYKALVEKSHRRFHPDRWRSRNLLKTVEDEAIRGCMEVGKHSNVDFSGSTSASLFGADSGRSPGCVNELRRRPNHPGDTSGPFVIILTSSYTRPSIVRCPRNQAQHVGRVESLLASLGLGRLGIQKRKVFVVLLWNVVWMAAQIIAIVTMVALSASVFKSPLHPETSEWSACDRPLGVWACLWIIRVLLSTILSYWEYLRELEACHHTSGQPSIHTVRVVLPPCTQYSPLSPCRLSVLCSLLTLSWFLTAHILEYTSINTCRHTSPHLWWLVFGILCVMYLMIFEVVIIGFIVLVITPIVFVFWNILLICLGRHPIQNPHIIKPDIDKIPKVLVEKIPLVMYIPPPPEGSDLKSTSPNVIINPHAYPPKASTKSANRSKPRFKFLKAKVSKKETRADTTTIPADVEKHPGSGEPRMWSDYWEESGYPFVVLEGNRAACAICLMDFEEPKRKPGLEHAFTPDSKEAGDETVVVESIDKDGEKGETVEVKSKEANGGSDSGITLEVRERESSPLRLEDAGEEAQPLRLLTCGHVFHKTCLDPWLTDVSGRCPVCQRPVEIPGQKTKKLRDRSQNSGS
ncbi:hypothetical protein P691DRAFT_795093 [Macrolepiota fuliginosa MF-IS2]|uniref:RING-type domain-containing protein n=1 Tax=Macrolepiota fuliginosa MF-IS2 TaxID=1400762 RepID=A0A9P5XKG7_9AGAR|nr:hypothetical protein P691DRAFT_795093 [Macrolepiota fuliginosa MF-IS2]